MGTMLLESWDDDSGLHGVEVFVGGSTRLYECFQTINQSERTNILNGPMRCERFESEPVRHGFRK